MSTDHCPESATFTIGIIWTACSFMSAIFMICTVFYLCKTHWKHRDVVIQRTNSKCLFIVEYIFNFMAIACTIAYGAKGAFWVMTCDDSSRVHYMMSMGWYGNQEFFFMMTLYLRLFVSFKDSSFKLSRRSHKVLIALFVFLPLVAFTNISIRDSIPTTISTVNSVIIATMSLSLSLTISGSFLWKLFTINKVSQTLNDNNKFLFLITRNTVLVTISISMSILCVITYGLIRGLFPDDDIYAVSTTWYIQWFMFLIDVDTNFICIALTNGAFTAWYYKLCTSLDSKCRTCCDEMANEKKKKMKKEEKQTAMALRLGVPTSPSAVVSEENSTTFDAETQSNISKEAGIQ